MAPIFEGRQTDRQDLCSVRGSLLMPERTPVPAGWHTVLSQLRKQSVIGEAAAAVDPV